MSTQNYQHITHEFEPIFDERSRILILGTLPSVKSREGQFYYHHPQNRFWPLLASLLEEEVPQLEDIPTKKKILEKHHIAMYDSIESCEILGSSDAHIRNVVPADIPGILAGTKIETICCNGAASYKYFMKYHGSLPIRVLKLPSTSPANAAWTLEKLKEAWLSVQTKPDRAAINELIKECEENG